MKKYLLLFIVCASLGLVVAAQIAHDARADMFAPEDPGRLFPLPPAAWVKKASFGFDNALADYFWLAAVQFTPLITRENMRFFEYMDIVTTMDPQFEYPYLLTLLVLPPQGFMAEAERIALRGIAAIPSSWQIPYYLGAQYHITGGSREKARFFLKMAAEHPESAALPGVRQTYAVVELGVGRAEATLTILKTLLETAENEKTREWAREMMETVLLVTETQKAIDAYKEAIGGAPQSLDEVVEAGFLHAVPEFSFNIVMDEHGVLRYKNILREER